MGSVDMIHKNGSGIEKLTGEYTDTETGWAYIKIVDYKFLPWILKVCMYVCMYVHARGSATHTQNPITISNIEKRTQNTDFKKRFFINVFFYEKTTDDKEATVGSSAYCQN
jgi:hypothetical protein